MVEVGINLLIIYDNYEKTTFESFAVELKMLWQKQLHCFDADHKTNLALRDKSEQKVKAAPSSQAEQC